MKSYVTCHNVQYEANRYDHLYWPIPGTENEDLIPLETNFCETQLL